MKELFTEMNTPTEVNPFSFQLSMIRAINKFEKLDKEERWQQQDVNGYWLELLKILQQHLKAVKKGDISQSYN